MSQSRKMSAVESVGNVLIGYGVAIISQLIVFPRFNIHIPFTDNLMIGIYFTIISLIRSYILRRFFNRIKS